VLLGIDPGLLPESKQVQLRLGFHLMTSPTKKKAKPVEDAQAETLDNVWCELAQQQLTITHDSDTAAALGESPGGELSSSRQGQTTTSIEHGRTRNSSKETLHKQHHND